VYQPSVNLSWIVILVVVIVLIGTILGFALSRANPNLVTIPSETPTPVPQDIRLQVSTVQSETVALRRDLDAISKMITSNPNSSPDVIALRLNVATLDTRLSTIEKAVLDNPEKALQFTLLTHDLTSIQSSFRAELDAIEQQIGQMYDLTKWFIALMFTIGLSVLGLAFTNLLRKPEKPTEEKTESQQSNHLI
jgi:hypothetical protein